MIKLLKILKKERNKMLKKYYKYLVIICLPIILVTIAYLVATGITKIVEILFYNSLYGI